MRENNNGWHSGKINTSKIVHNYTINWNNKRNKSIDIKEQKRKIRKEETFNNNEKNPQTSKQQQQELPLFFVALNLWSPNSLPIHTHSLQPTLFSAIFYFSQLKYP